MAFGECVYLLPSISEMKAGEAWRENSVKTNSNEKERIIIHVITLLTLEVMTFF